MDGKFAMKSRLVSNCHKTDAPSSITYLSVISRDIVRIAFRIASLNDLDICDCGIEDTYLNANFK